MPKRVNNLFEKIVSFENLVLASKKSRKGKRYRDSTLAFDLNLELNLINLQKELIDKTYKPSAYREFFINDSKKRLITAAPYKDRVIHHAMMNILEPIFEKSFIYDSYSCIKEKGTHKAIQRYKKFAKQNTYVLKCDIKKYFHNINHEVLYSQIKRKIKCKDTLSLTKLIIDSKYDSFINSKKKGIPIGNLTSQVFANIYLNDFDHFIKEKLGLKYYIRYCDDFVIFHNDKKVLNIIKKLIEIYLKDYDLQIHENKSRVYRVNDGVNFLGFRIFENYMLVNKQTVRRYIRKLDKKYYKYQKNKEDFLGIKQSIQSWLGHVKHTNSYKLREMVLSSYIL